VRARCGPLRFPVRDRSEKNCRGEPVESLLLLCESQALTNRRLDPLNEVVSRFDRPCPIDQSSDHFRLRDVPAPRPSRQAGGALFIELHGDRWHGNTQILPCGAIGSRGSLFAIRYSLFAVRGSLFAVRYSRFAIRGSRFAVRGSRFAVRRFAIRGSVFYQRCPMDAMDALRKARIENIGLITDRNQDHSEMPAGKGSDGQRSVR